MAAWLSVADETQELLCGDPLSRPHGGFILQGLHQDHEVLFHVISKNSPFEAENLQVLEPRDPSAPSKVSPEVLKTGLGVSLIGT